jgi:hypothetical protein
VDLLRSPELHGFDSGISLPGLVLAVDHAQGGRETGRRSGAWLLRWLTQRPCSCSPMVTAIVPIEKTQAGFDWRSGWLGVFRGPVGAQLSGANRVA